MLGYPGDARDAVTTALKVGIVLTLATSWSAYRTVVYSVVLYGPAEIAGQITGASGLASSFDLLSRLENVDNGIVALTVAGTGRDESNGTTLTQAAPGQTPQLSARDVAREAAFKTVAVDDTFGMGFSRVVYLAGTLAPLAILRIGAGLLLALGPVVAGLLLFTGTRGLFFGWLRSLAAIALGSFAMIVSLSAELALIEPWLTDVLARRTGERIAPAAPTELVVITLVFAVLAFGLLTLFGRLAFAPSAVVSFVRPQADMQRSHQSRATQPPAVVMPPAPPTRAEQIAERLTTIYRGRRSAGAEPRGADGPTGTGGIAGGRMADGVSTGGAPAPAYVPLGSSYRRSARRTSQVTNIRDGRR
jgi:type IV secretion system protein VirB6